MDYVKYEKRITALKQLNTYFAEHEELPVEGFVGIETGNGRGIIKFEGRNIAGFNDILYEYKLILLGEDKGTVIYQVWGPLNIEDGGGLAGSCKFNPRNVDGKGHDLKNYNVAVLAAVSRTDEKEPLHPIMKGVLAEAENEEDRSRETFSGYYRDYLRNKCETLEKKYILYEEIAPFDAGVTRATWRRIGNVSQLPVLSPRGEYEAARYNHFIFGTDETFFYIGVPGRYIPEEQPEKGASGFCLWIPLAGAEMPSADYGAGTSGASKTAYGYWIAAVNRRSGELEKVSKT